ncbi:hypothetical protein H0H81_001331 [Sphagnurus paluster]|uniref:Enhancer of polycomb-like protein n=1 Tax=Sphagnurus paluster TaxID=117069 RepID=A0A9P7GK16_9AGAR|nr:hypothetical protein H0H81_001331 [Sphagnurus paluster]
MARLTGTSTRIRNRQISLKARLRVVQGELEADPLYIPDEDEEKNHLTNLVAGVDAEDAYEHHLQVVLNASSGGAANKNALPVAYIPTPGATGLVDQYTDLYPAARWKDPSTYLCTSVTPEESCKSAIANGFTYYMDERDKEWLDKNNEEARGEGTSAQGALSSSTRTSARSAKAKGKEPEPSQVVAISEDEFELVMGLFEKVTHEKTEYLHHSLETGMSFPTFSDYQDTFSSPLPPPTFASYSVPSWIPRPLDLYRIAHTIYPYWKERRIERGGHRIIPSLNGDETDTLNESYVCFRRREIKTVRKTRASQSTSSDKLIRLQSEFVYPLELAKYIFQREHRKREVAIYACLVGQRRLALSQFKRKYPQWGDNADEDLLIDKEKPRKAEISRPAKIRPEVRTSVLPEVIMMRPTERIALINQAIDVRLAHQKEQDHHWEDQIDNTQNPYQTLFVPHPARYFKYISANLSASSSDRRPIQERRVPRAIRPRRGRGGRLFVDRRDSAPRPIVPVRRSMLFEHGTEDVEMEELEVEVQSNLEERWRFDMDDVPTVGPDGPEDRNRVLIDDYRPKTLCYSMTLILDSDQQSLINDATIPVINGDHQQRVLPFRLGLQPPQIRRGPGPPRPAGLQGSLKSGASPALSNPPLILAHQLKMPPPATVPHPRILSNGGMRPPPFIGTSPFHLSQSSPSNAVPSPPHHSSLSSNGVHRAAINLPHIDAAKLGVAVNPSSNGAIQQHAQSDTTQSHEHRLNGAALIYPQAISILNRYTLTPQTAATLANSAQLTYHGAHGLSVQQMQNIKTAFTNPQDVRDSTAAKGFSRALPSYPQSSSDFNLQQMAAASNLNLKLPTARQIQWASSNPPTVNGIDEPISASIGLAMPAPVPVRMPSTNGTIAGIHIGTNGQLCGHVSPHVQHNSSALSPLQSPPRVPYIPAAPRASPLMQHQQASGSSKSGY